MHDAVAPSAHRMSLGDEEAALRREFEECARESGSLAFRVAFAVLRQHADAEDVAQEALARCFRRFGSLRDRGRFRPWLARISWRLALDHRRAGLRRERREQASLAQSSPRSEPPPAAHEFRERLFREIEALPENLRLVIVLAGIEGYDGREVARLLGLPEGTVKSRLHAARRRLAEALR